MNEFKWTENRLKLSTIEHNPTALHGYLNNPGWYAYGHRINLSRKARMDRIVKRCMREYAALEHSPP